VLTGPRLSSLFGDEVDGDWVAQDFHGVVEVGAHCEDSVESVIGEDQGFVFLDEADLWGQGSFAFHFCF